MKVTAISAVLASCTALLQFVAAQAQVTLPSSDKAWRGLPIMPHVFITDSVKYALFAGGNGYLLTF